MDKVTIDYDALQQFLNYIAIGFFFYMLGRKHGYRNRSKELKTDLDFEKQKDAK